MSKITVLIGVPGSGKSTYAKEEVEKNPNVKRVNPDDLRTMMGRYKEFSPEREAVVFGTEEYMVRKLLEEGFDVIVDATNLQDKYRRKWKELAALHRAEYEQIIFHISRDEMFARNDTRPVEDRIDDQEVLERMWLNYHGKVFE